MKKLVLICILVLLALPIFSHDVPLDGDDYAKFQGVWYDVDEKYAFIIFIDDIFISNVDLGFSLHYSVEDNNLIIHHCFWQTTQEKFWEKVSDQLDLGDNPIQDDRVIWDTENGLGL
jgi:hypothetical protein